MPNDKSFLREIANNPADRALRLVYADWLEEQGDSRAQWVRVEEALRDLAPYSDAYWERKEERKRLRPAPKTWRTKMGYDGPAPLFGHGVPRSWEGRWRLIREYVERWHGLPMPDVGGRADEVASVEDRLGRKISPSLREWVAFAHDVQVSRRNKGVVLRDGYQMHPLEGHAAVSLILQAEGDYHWAVRNADLRRADPPVYGFHLDYETDEPGQFVPARRNPLHATTTEFVMDYVMVYTYADGGGFSVEAQRPAKLLRDLAAAFPVQSQFGPIQLFESDDILVRITPRSWGDDAPRLSVQVRRTLPIQAIPGCLLDQTNHGGMYYGMFIRR